jgi:fluoride exporter
MNYVWIFIGGGLGSIARFELGQKISRLTGTGFPFATIGVNMVSCLILGILLGIFGPKAMQNNTAKLFIGIGFCGGFSTFSAFTAETFELLRTGNYFFAGANMLLSIAVCLFSFWAGWQVNRIF